MGVLEEAASRLNIAEKYNLMDTAPLYDLWCSIRKVKKGINPDDCEINYLKS